MKPSLRPALDSDLAFCESLCRSNMAAYHAARGVAWEPARFAATWDAVENHMILVDGQVAGVLRLLAVDDALEIRDLQLLPEHRGRGIGTWAISQAMSQASGRGIGSLRLRVFQENPSMRFYARLGFTADAVGEDGKVHMSRALSVA